MPATSENVITLAKQPSIAEGLVGIAKKLVDPSGPAPLRQLAAKGLAPGLKPADVLAVLVVLTTGDDESLAATARTTLGALPDQMVTGMLGGPLHPLALHEIAPVYAKDTAFAEKILQHPNVAVETVAAMAQVSTEAVSELIATNEERLLAAPTIIEALYRNKATRMSTADRIVELAIRNQIELSGIAAYRELTQALQNELIPEPSDEPTYDDLAFLECEALAEETAGILEDIAEVDKDSGQEVVKEQFRKQETKFQDLNTSGKIRRATVGKASDRMMAMRDTNPLVRAAGAKSEALTVEEATLVAGNFNMSEDVLRILGNNRNLTQKHVILVKLAMNPRTPLAISAKFIPFLRDGELRALAGSKNVKGDLAKAAKQQLDRKGKG